MAKQRLIRPGLAIFLHYVLTSDPGLKRNEEWYIANPCLSYLWLLSVNVLFTYNITTDMLLATVDTKLFTGNYPKLRLTWPQLFLILSLLILIFLLCILVLCNCLWCLPFWQLVWIHLFINKSVTIQLSFFIYFWFWTLKT